MTWADAITCGLAIAMTVVVLTAFVTLAVIEELEIRRAIRRAKRLSKKCDITTDIYHDSWNKRAMERYLSESVKSLYNFDGKPTGIKFYPHNKHDRTNG